MKILFTLILVAFSNPLQALQMSSISRYPAEVRVPESVIPGAPKMETISGPKPPGIFYTATSFFCDLPEIFKDKGNPRWETERPHHKVLLNFYNPNFKNCRFQMHIRGSTESHVRVSGRLRWLFEKKIPSKLRNYKVAPRTIEFPFVFEDRFSQITRNALNPKKVSGYINVSTIKIPNDMEIKNQSSTVEVWFGDWLLTSIPMDIDASRPVDFVHFDLIKNRDQTLLQDSKLR